MAAVRSLLPRDERRAQILRAAGATFAVEGYVATSVDDVAKAAGITKLIVYRHFESKADLYRAILEETSERLVEEWVADFGDGAESKPAVATLLRVARELPDGFRLLFVHAAREADFVEFAADFRRLLLDVADARIGDQLPAGSHRVWLSGLMVDSLVAAVLGWLEVGRPSDDEVWVADATDALAAMFDSAVGSPAAVRSRGAEPPRQGVPAPQ